VNAALAEYYGNVLPDGGRAVEKVSSGEKARITELHHMKNVVAGCGGLDMFPKSSGDLDAAALADPNVRAAVEFFGGAQEALTKTAGDLSWVRAFIDGERDGADLAVHSVMALFERAAESVQS